MTEILQHPYAQAFARALVHFVWQGAAIGIVGYVLLRRVPLSARSRHATGVGLLAVMLAAPLLTTWYFSREAPAFRAGGTSEFAPAAEPAAAATVALASPAPASVSTFPPSNAAPIVNPVAVLALWLTGVAVLSIRLAGGWLVARRLAGRAFPLAAPDVQSLARRVAGRLALDRVVRIVESSTVAVPVMIGWIKPVVILPTAALAGLTPLQVEALLAHELAHVCRHDYLVNLLQSVVETVLFYHPAVWWVSGEVRAAREQCCDDLAVGVCDRLVYATALAELAAMAKAPRLALAAADGSLADRVRRVLGQPLKPRDERAAWMPVVLITIVTIVIGGRMPAALTSAATDQSSVTGDVPSGVVTEVPIGVPDDVSAVVPSDAPAGVPGGAAVGGQDQTTAGQSEKLAAVKTDMLAQLLAHAQRNLEDTRRAVEIGTMTKVDVQDAEATFARLQLEVAAQDKLRASEKPLAESEAALVKLKFAEAMRKLEAEEVRFAVGLASVKAVDEAVMAAMQVATKSAGDQKTSKAAEQAAAERAAKAEEISQILKLQLDEVLKKLARTKELVAQSLASQSDLDQLTDILKNLEAKLRASEMDQKLVAVYKSRQDEYQAELAKVNLEAVQAKLERAKKMADAGLVSQQAVQEAEEVVKRARLELMLKPMETRPDTALSAPAAALRDRILREGEGMSDDALIGVLKDAGKLAGDIDRAEVLLAFARRQTLTPEMATLYVAAAAGIKSDDERARVFRQPVRLRQGKGK